MGTLILIIILIGFEYAAYKSEHRQMSSIHALKRQAISLDNALKKNGRPRRHIKHIRGLA